MAVSLRLPEKTKQRVERLARKRDITAHAFMVAAIEERLVIEEARAAYHAEGECRLEQLKKTGMAIPATEAFDYLRKRAQGQPAVRPKSRKIARLSLSTARSPTLRGYLRLMQSTTVTPHSVTSKRSNLPSWCLILTRRSADELPPPLPCANW